MTDPITEKDIDGKYHKQLFIQDYSKKPLIEGVKIVEVRNIVGEDGDFNELLRFGDNGEAVDFPGFFVKQINRSKMIPGSIKAWHLHFKQDDIWYILPTDTLLVGLWDIRKNSPTKNVTMRLAVGGGKSYLVYIPKGVAHGAANLSQKETTMFYFVNQNFNIEDPDEIRLPWDAVPDFWELTKG